MAEQKLAWTFDRNIPNADLRQARALEYIAQYLDRIDDHLSKISASLTEAGPKDVALSISLANIVEALKAKS